MPVDLSKIPGAGASRDRNALRPFGRRRKDVPEYRPQLIRDPHPKGKRRGRRRIPLQFARSLSPVDVVIAAAFVLIGLYVLRAFWNWTRVDVEVTGLSAGAHLQPEATEGLDVVIDVEPDERVERASMTLDGQPLEPEQLEERPGGFRVRPGLLTAGAHTLALSVPRPVLGDSRFRWEFVVDGTPPSLEVASPIRVGVCDPVPVSGRVEPGAELTVNGEPADNEDGRFSLRYDRAPGPLAIAATDRAGNVTNREVLFATPYPGAQGMHVTAAAWNYAPLRDDILGMVDAGLASVVQLDLKDEDGVVGYDSEVPLAHDVGAVRVEYDLEEAVELLHDRGVRVIGRIVAFRDAPVARWAWDNGHTDWVVQTTDGEMHPGYGGFTNVAHPDVRRYNIDIALEAAEAGVDEILWDYARRPEGDINGMVFPGLAGTPEDGVVGFLAEARTALHEHCVLQGVSVFGIAADRPWTVGQDVPRMARNVDYMAPLLYPSHWADGEYRVENPNGQPYEIVLAALADFQAKAEGTGVTFVPWIQDFSLGHPYGPAEVRAQIDAAAALGVGNWLLWNAGVQYTVEALAPIP